jgi:hypothetical protein
MFLDLEHQESSICVAQSELVNQSRISFRTLLEPTCLLSRYLPSTHRSHRGYNHNPYCPIHCCDKVDLAWLGPFLDYE